MMGIFIFVQKISQCLFFPQKSGNFIFYEQHHVILIIVLYINS